MHSFMTKSIYSAKHLEASKESRSFLNAWSLTMQILISFYITSQIIRLTHFFSQIISLINQRCLLIFLFILDPTLEMYSFKIFQIKKIVAYLFQERSLKKSDISCRCYQESDLNFYKRLIIPFSRFIRYYKSFYCSTLKIDFIYNFFCY